MKKQQLPDSLINNIDSIMEILLQDEELRNDFVKINFKKLCQKYTLPISFIEKYAEYLPWNYIINDVDVGICVKYKQFINFNSLSLSNIKLSEEFIDVFFDKLNIKYVISDKKVKNFSELFIKKYSDYDLFWNDIVLYRKLSTSFIIELFDKLTSYEITILNLITYQKLSEDVLRKLCDKIKNCDKIKKLNINQRNFWERLSTYQTLSESFIADYQDNLSWNHICGHQVLSEDFIRKFQNKVNWSNISHCQKLSENFIREFANKVNWNDICIRQNLSEDFIREFANKVNWGYIFDHQNLSKEFIKEFSSKKSY